MEPRGGATRRGGLCLLLLLLLVVLGLASASDDRLPSSAPGSASSGGDSGLGPSAVAVASSSSSQDEQQQQQQHRWRGHHGHHGHHKHHHRQDTEQQQQQQQGYQQVGFQRRQDAPPVGQFVPEADWKEILPNEAIPPGLDVRIDFAAGKKFARLHQPPTADEQLQDQREGVVLVPAPEDASDQSAAPPEDAAQADDAPLPGATLGPVLVRVEWEQLQSRTNGSALPDAAAEPEQLSSLEPTNLTDEQLKRIMSRPWYKGDSNASATAFGRQPRRSDQPESSERNQVTAPDHAAMAGLLQKLIAFAASHQPQEAPEVVDVDEPVVPSAVQEHVEALEDLEDSLHKWENAHAFVQNGGLRVLHDLLRVPFSPIRAAATWTVGTAAQNNAMVQSRALQEGMLDTLVQLLDKGIAALRTASGDGSKALEAELKKVIYALSALCRNNPDIQDVVARLGLFPKLKSVLSDPRFSPALKNKAAALVNDILSQAMADSDAGAQPGGLLLVDNNDDDIIGGRKGRMRAVAGSALVDEMAQDSDLCHLLPPLLGVQDEDTQETTLRTMFSIRHTCCFDLPRGLDNKLQQQQQQQQQPRDPHWKPQLCATVVGLANNVNAEEDLMDDDDFQQPNSNGGPDDGDAQLVVEAANNDDTPFASDVAKMAQLALSLYQLQQ